MTSDLFDLSGKVAVVTGGYGVLGGRIAEALAEAGARTAIVGRDRDAAEARADLIRRDGNEAMAVPADVLDADSLHLAADRVIEAWGCVDVLVNAAGGNVARARTDGKPVFDLPLDAFDEAVRLNLHGTVYPTLVFGEIMADRKSGSLINISSMAAVRPLSGIVAYSAAKAAIDKFTRWMAVDLAERHGPGVRVNAIAPGFFVSKQNEAVLKNPDGSLTDRSRRILAHTPMRRFGDPSDLCGTAVWLASEASSFVTGAVIPVDGGFSAYGGV